MSQEPAQALLAEISTLHDSTVRDRRAFWMPLLLLGLFVMAAAPLYVTVNPPASICRSNCSTGIFGDDDLWWLFALGGGVLGAYWAFVLVASSAVTAVWYAWHARVTGLRTGGDRVAALWLGGVVVLLLLSTVAIGLVPFMSSVLMHHNAALLIIAVGLTAMAVLERSRTLTWTTAVFWVWCVWAVVGHGTGKGVQWMGDAGIALPESAWRMAQGANFVVAGSILVIGAATALHREFRDR